MGMIGLVFRSLCGGGLFDGFFLVFGAAAFSLCALCGLYKCRSCRIRDCGCCKSCLRNTGVDKFDDFEMIVVVHEALFTGAKARAQTCVRMTAGMQTVTTAESEKGAVFHESLSIFVEQGTQFVVVELMNARERRVLASLKLDPLKDLLESENLRREKVWPMKQKSKGLLNPRIRLSMVLDSSGEELEKGLLADTDMSRETDMLLRSQIHKQESRKTAKGVSDTSGDDGGPQKEMSKIELFASGCTGNLDQFGSWGSRESCWVCVTGPPDKKKWTLCIYKDKSEHSRGNPPRQEVEILKVRSVQADPARPEVFIINFVDAKKMKDRVTFCRVDRGRDVWVEVFTLLIMEIREEKEAKQAKRDKKK